jgi:hypothetical protein
LTQQPLQFEGPQFGWGWMQAPLQKSPAAQTWQASPPLPHAEVEKSVTQVPSLAQHPDGQLCTLQWFGGGVTTSGASAAESAASAFASAASAFESTASGPLASVEASTPPIAVSPATAASVAGPAEDGTSRPVRPQATTKSIVATMRRRISDILPGREGSVDTRWRSGTAPLTTKQPEGVACASGYFGAFATTPSDWSHQ